MKTKAITTLMITLFLISMVFNIVPTMADASYGGYITLSLTVEGVIQTSDPWSGDWDRPMYYLIEGQAYDNTGYWWRANIINY